MTKRTSPQEEEPNMVTEWPCSDYWIVVLRALPQNPKVYFRLRSVNKVFLKALDQILLELGKLALSEMRYIPCKYLNPMLPKIRHFCVDIAGNTRDPWVKSSLEMMTSLESMEVGDGDYYDEEVAQRVKKLKIYMKVCSTTTLSCFKNLTSLDFAIVHRIPLLHTVLPLSLKSLKISHNDQLNQSDITYLTNLTSLKLRNHTYSEYWHKFSSVFQNFTSLTKLSLSPFPIAIMPEDIAPFAASLKSFRIVISSYIDVDRLLQKMTGLTSLRLEARGMISFTGASLLGMPFLKSLHLKHVDTSDDNIIQLTQLESLVLDGNYTVGNESLSKMSNLTSLAIMNDHMLNNECLRGKPKLRDLYLDENRYFWKIDPEKEFPKLHRFYQYLPPSSSSSSSSSDDEEEADY